MTDEELLADEEHGGICEECGNDESQAPYRFCLDCLEELAPGP